MADVTPLCPYPFISETLTLPNETTIVEGTGPYNNTKEILILNLDDTNALYVRILDLGSAAAIPADPTLVQQSNSLVIPAGLAVSLAIGSEGQRNQIAPTSFWAASGPGTKFVLAFRAAAGEDVLANVTYIQNSGGEGARG